MLLTEGIGRLVVAQALIGSSRTVQARLAHRQAHGFDKQAVVGIVYIPCITQAAVRCHHTLQRQLLVVTGHGVGSLLGHVYTVDGAILPDNVLTGIDQVHGHRRRCLTSGLHGAIDQEHARQTGNKVVGGSDIIVQEGSAAVNADGIDVAETTKVFGFCISYGVAVRIGYRQPAAEQMAVCSL